MIKSLIVDDEKLVRKGIISLFPWEQFDIEIVGEAGDGETALNLLQEKPVDLMFVDLTMPVMGGLELMKVVGERFPDIYKVVLTCHQDFDYIQKAMRLGAIDYIVKTQLDQDTMEDSLKRISSRIVRDRQNQDPVWSSVGNGHEIAGYVLAGEESAIFPFGFIEPESVFKINESTWFVSHVKSHDVIRQIQFFISQQDHWIWLDVVDTRVHSVSDFLAKQRALVPLFLFYRIEPGQKTGELSLKSVSAKCMNGLEDWPPLREKWLDMRWIYEDDDFIEILGETATTMPVLEKLLPLLNELFDPWIEIIQNEHLRKRLQEIESFPFWYQWVDWLKSIRSQLRTEMKRHSYASEFIVNLVKAIRHIQLSDDYTLNRDELATRYLMSGSYFSQCFKDVVQQPYGEYVKEIRLNKAARLLRETNHHVYRIAREVGFQDDKYFSKLFRQHFGLNPQDLRRQWTTSVEEKA